MANNETQAEQAQEKERAEETHRTAKRQRSAEEVRRELLDALGDLRAELARLQIDEARGKLRKWVRDNPTLAVFLATGTGILVGRVLVKAFTPSPPPPLSERARRRARTLATEAQQRASDVGKNVSKRASEARRRADRVRRDAQQRAAETSGQLSRQARDWSQTVAERAEALRDEASNRARTFGAAVGKEAENVGKNVSRRAAKATEKVKASSQGLSDTADKARAGYKAARFGMKAAKWAFVVLMARNSAKWIRKIL